MIEELLSDEDVLENNAVDVVSSGTDSSDND